MVKQGGYFCVSLLQYPSLWGNEMRGKGGGKWDPWVTEACGKIHWVEVDEV